MNAIHRELNFTRDVMTEVAQYTAHGYEFLEKQEVLQLNLLADAYLNNAFAMEYVNLEQAFNAINAGRLTPLLVPKEMFDRVSYHVNSKLRAINSDLYVPPLTPAEIYNMLRVFWSRKNSDILITVHIPLSGRDNSYTIYELKSFSIPVNRSDAASVKLTPGSFKKYLRVIFLITSSEHCNKTLFNSSKTCDYINTYIR